MTSKNENERLQTTMPSNDQGGILVAAIYKTLQISRMRSSYQERRKSVLLVKTLVTARAKESEAPGAMIVGQQIDGRAQKAKWDHIGIGSAKDLKKAKLF
jgi:hypothetical protein